MSLEQAIKENTETMKQLISALTNTAVATANISATTAVVEEPKAETPKKAATKKAAAVKAEAPSTLASEAVVSTAIKVSYDDVKTATLKLANQKGRAVAEEVLSKFGVAKATELKFEQYADYVKEANDKLAA